MKRLILAVLATLLLAPIADAQINLKKREQPETIMKMRMGYISLNRVGETYYLAIRSDNQFDDHYIIYLGKDRRKAIESLTSLVDLADTIKKNESFEFDNGNETIDVCRGVMKGELWFKAEGYAGYGRTSKPELNKMLESLLYANGISI